MTNCLKCGSSKVKKLSGDFLECKQCAHIFSPRDGAGRSNQRHVGTVHTAGRTGSQYSQQRTVHTSRQQSGAVQTSRTTYTSHSNSGFGNGSSTKHRGSGSEHSYRQYMRPDGTFVSESKVFRSNVDDGGRNNRRRKPTNVLVIKCSKCGESCRSGSTIRPITINCKCGAMIVLK